MKQIRRQTVYKLDDLKEELTKEGNWLLVQGKEHKEFFGGEGKDTIITVDVYEGIIENIAQRIRDILPKNYIVELWDLGTIIISNP